MIDQHISEFMNAEVLQGEPSTPLRTVIRKMNESGHSAFIVCEAGRPVGVISERDTISFLHSLFEGEDLEGATAGDVMTTPVKSLPEFASMAEVMRMLRENGFRRVPVIDEKERLAGIINLADLQNAMNGALEKRGRDLEVAVMKRTAALQAANARLEEISIHDSLTGLLNRRSLDDRLGELHALTRRYRNPYSVLMADIDHFKAYNDSQGHIAGDEALVALSRLLEKAVRESDSVFRYGGEEFLITMPETDAEGARLVGERIQSLLAERAIPHVSSETAPWLTVSIGIVTIDHSNVRSFDEWTDVVEAADRCLYRAKETGRNRIRQQEPNA